MTTAVVLSAAAALLSDAATTFRDFEAEQRRLSYINPGSKGICILERHARQMAWMKAREHAEHAERIETFLKEMHQ